VQVSAEREYEARYNRRRGVQTPRAIETGVAPDLPPWSGRRKGEMHNRRRAVKYIQYN